MPELEELIASSEVGNVDLAIQVSNYYAINKKTKEKILLSEKLKQYLEALINTSKEKKLTTYEKISNEFHEGTATEINIRMNMKRLRNALYDIGLDIIRTTHAQEEDRKGYYIDIPISLHATNHGLSMQRSLEKREYLVTNEKSDSASINSFQARELEVFLKSENGFVSRETLIELNSHYSDISSLKSGQISNIKDNIASHMNRLGKILDKLGYELVTIFGEGYQLKEKENSQII